METSDLVNKLSDSVEPVKPLPAPHVRCLFWLLASFLCVGACVALAGLRHNIHEVMFTPVFLLEALAIVALTVMAAAGAFFLSVPGTEKKYSRIMPLVLICFLLVLVSWSFIAEGFSLACSPGGACVQHLILFALIPGILLFYLIRRAAATSEKWTGVLVFISAAALGSLGLHFTCAQCEPLHVLFFHFLPILVLAALGAWIGKKSFSWEKRIKKTIDEL